MAASLDCSSAAVDDPHAANPDRGDRALRAARVDHRTRWASIAAAAGHYDQAHLIAEFRAIAGVTPRTLLGELRADPSLI